MHIQDSVTVLKGVGKQKAEDLQKLGIITVGDLLGHYPYRYEDRSHMKPLREMREGDIETITGIILQVQDMIMLNFMLMELIKETLLIAQ